MNLKQLKDKLLQNPETREQYEKLKPEFDKARWVIASKRKVTN